MLVLLVAWVLAGCLTQVVSLPGVYV